MFKVIMVPVDMAHVDTLQRAFAVAGDLCRHYGAVMHIVDVTATAPGQAAHSPKELEGKLEAEARTLADTYGVPVHAKTVVSHDPAVELSDNLSDTAHELNADLVVMASHKPGLLQFIFHSHAGDFAADTDLSVFIVR